MGSLGDYLKNQERVLHLFVRMVVWGGQTVDYELLTVIYSPQTCPILERKTLNKRTQDSLAITNMKIWKRNLQ